MLTLVCTQDANCEFCGALLDGSAFQCIRCNAQSCTSCICRSGSCPSCVGSSKPTLSGKWKAVPACGRKIRARFLILSTEKFGSAQDCLSRSLIFQLAS